MQYLNRYFNPITSWISGPTQMITAVSNNNRILVEFLADRGVSDFTLPLIVALHREHIDLARLLIKGNGEIPWTEFHQEAEQIQKL